MDELTKLLIFSLLISFSLSFENKIVKYADFINKPLYSVKVSENISYNISYNKGDIKKNYIKIQIKSSDENEFLYAYYSPISQKRSDAYLLNSGKGEIYLYINKAFTKLEAKGNIYLSIACFNQNCTFDLSSSEVEFIDLNRNSQYRYFTTNKKNLVNTFIVNGNENISESDYISFLAFGNKNINMKINSVYNGKNKEIDSNSFDYGKYAIFKEGIDKVDYYIIEVTAPANSLITFGNDVNTCKGEGTSYKRFIVNSNEIYGVLTKESNIQCFDLNIGVETHSFLSILDFNVNLKVIYNGKENNKTNTIITDGNIVIPIYQKFKNNRFCLSRIDNEIKEDSPFSLQITSNISNNYYKNIFSPQINGFFYERYLESGTFAFFTGLFSIDFKTELRYYLKKKEGYPIMYLVKCTTYPNCKFNITSLPSDFIEPIEINNIFSYSIFKTDIKKLIDPEQYVLLVYCNNGSDCLFKTNFYSELDQIVLPENKRTYHTIMYQGENNFLIKFKKIEQLQELYVNFLTYTGDISIKPDLNRTNFSMKTFLTGNRKYFVFNVSNATDKINNEIYFTIKGELASFYSTGYNLITNKNKYEINEETGINYLETLDPKDERITIKLINRRILENSSFAVNFFPLNCKINVTKTQENNKSLKTLGSLSQDIITNQSTIFRIGFYEYSIKVIKMESITWFEENLCMVYLSSIEINTDMDKKYQKRHLLISESVINRVILNELFPNIEYIYPHMSPKGYVAINFNWQTKSKVTIIININKKEYKKFETTQSQYTIIPEKDLRSSNYCPYNETKPNQVCSIIVQIKLDSEYYDDEPIIKFSIKSQEVIPAFIKKSMIRKDIVVGNYYQYFYTEVGFQEDGDINIKFDRGSGKVYGRIVSKDTNENQGWMNRIMLPDENNNDLIYNYYTKKLIYESNKTNNCTKGCYLILKVEPNFSDDYYKSENIAYPITLSLNAKNANKSFSTQDNITVVDIPLNEFIVGDTKQTVENFTYFYSLFIPYDCEKLIIEFLCESSYIFVNVGDIKPKINISHFKYKVMDKDGILEITKDQILSKLSENDNKTTIKNVQLTIAIGAQYFDDCNSSVYSFRIRAKRKNETELISLTSDQETLCYIIGKNGNCYFIIPQNGIIDEQNNLFFHAMFLPNAQFNYYANEVPKEYITDRNENITRDLLPTKEKNKWSNNNSRGNYLYIDNREIENKTNHYILLNLEVFLPYNDEKENKTITLLHSIYSYKGIILPNPASVQLFLVNNNNNNELKFNFDPKGDNLLIRLISISGKGVVYWNKSDDNQFDENIAKSPVNSNDENTYFFFNDPGDSITLTFSTKEDNQFPLHFRNIEKNEQDSNESPGFGFCCFYERESKSENYNYVNFGENSKYNFVENDFPFIFYTMIPDKEHTIDVNIQLTSLIKKYSRDNNNLVVSEDIVQLTPLYDEFSINGTIVDENKTYSKHVNTSIAVDIEKDMEKGVYDPINKILRIQFTSEYIKGKKIEGNNYIYIKINKSYTMEFEEVTMEISVLPSNNTGYIVEKSKYVYGQIPKNQKSYNRYELSRINKYYKYMRIEFSSNSNNINFTLNSFKFSEDIKNINFNQNNIDFTPKINNGKTVAIINFKDDEIISIFLSVFYTSNNEDNLSNFIFKYDIIGNGEDFINIEPQGNVLDTTQDKNRSIMNITLPKFNSKITKGNKVNFNYIFKLFKNDSANKNEKFDSIALTDTKAIRIYKKSITNPSPNDIIVTLTDIHNDTNYFVIGIVEVLVGANYKELFSYLCLEKKEEKKESNTKVIILCSVLGGVVLIGIIFLIYCLVLKKGNLIKSKKLEQLTKKMNSDSSLNLNSVD